MLLVRRSTIRRNVGHPISGTACTIFVTPILRVQSTFSLHPAIPADASTITTRRKFKGTFFFFLAASATHSFHCGDRRSRTLFACKRRSVSPCENEFTVLVDAFDLPSKWRPPRHNPQNFACSRVQQPGAVVLFPITGACPFGHIGFPQRMDSNHHDACKVACVRASSWTQGIRTHTNGDGRYPSSPRRSQQEQ